MTQMVFNKKVTREELDWEQENHLTRKARASRKINHAKQTRAVYMDAVHRYQLCRGDSPFGAPVEMLGSEARAKNLEFERKFMDAKQPGARMWKYRWLKWEETDGGT